MIVLHIDCSARGTSHSRQLSAAIIERLVVAIPGIVVVRRDLGREPIPHVTAEYADSIASPEAIMASEGALSQRLSNQLIDELEAADVVVIGTPMHNFTVPSVLKAWIDQVLRAGRTILSGPDGKIGALKDKLVFVAVASGGTFSGGRANQPDLLTPYLAAALDCIGLRSLHFLALQATAFTHEGALKVRQRALLDEAEMLIRADARLGSRLLV